MEIKHISNIKSSTYIYQQSAYEHIEGLPYIDVLH